MGMYSKNRISSISANESVTDFLGEEVNSDNLLNEYYIENIDKNSDFTNMLETSILIRNDERQLFENLLESDFVTSMKEQMLITETTNSMRDTNTEKKKDIISKYNSYISTVLNGTKQSGLKTSSKISDMISSINYDDYKNIINPENGQGFKGIRNFKLPGKEFENTLFKRADLKKYLNTAIKYANQVKTAKSKDAVDILFKKFGDDISAIYNGLNNEIAQNCSTKVGFGVKWIPTNNEYKTIVSFMNGSRIESNISKATQSIANSLNQLQTSLVSIMNSIDCSDGEFSLYKINKIRSIGTSTGYLIVPIVDGVNSLFVSEFGAYRKAFLVLGHYCSKRLKKKTVSEVVLYSIGESSDIYVSEYFDY